jgi:hypothetical protein
MQNTVSAPHFAAEMVPESGFGRSCRRGAPPKMLRPALHGLHSGHNGELIVVSAVAQARTAQRSAGALPPCLMSQINWLG